MLDENKIKHSDHVHGIIETMYGWHGSLEWNQARNKQCPCRTLNLNICRDYFRFRNEAKVNDFLAHINRMSQGDRIKSICIKQNKNRF